MDISSRRNLAVVGLHHAGKTTLTEAILFHCGAIPRRGSVADHVKNVMRKMECTRRSELIARVFHLDREIVPTLRVI